MTFRFAAALAVALSTTAASAASPAADWMFISGSLNVGSFGTEIGEYSLATKSAQARKIISACKNYEVCEARVRADPDKAILSVDKARQVGPFATPKDLVDFIYSHYSGWSPYGFPPGEEEQVIDLIYSSRLASLVKAANSKAGKADEESPAYDPWLEAQDWKIENVKIIIEMFGVDRARGDVSLTNYGAPDAYVFTLVKNGPGWVIDDVTSKNPAFKGAPPFAAMLVDYLRPGDRIAEKLPPHKEPEVVATASPGTLPSLNKGTHYSQAREQLMSLGYKGVKIPGADACDASSSTTCFPEMESCAGTGEGNCLYAWEKGDTFVEVSTVGDPPEVASVSRGQKPKP